MVDVKQILSQMTTEEKIGQLMQHNANMFIDSSAAVTGDNSNKLGLSQEVINTVGSVLNFCSSVEMRTIQDMHLKNDRNKIPMLFMMDVVHGFRTIFPIPLALGCSFDPNLAARCSEMAADEATAGGVQVTFTPMVDYVRDAVGVQLDKISVDQTVVAAADADAVDPEQIRCTYHCAHCCVHAGRVTAGGQYADPFYGITHKSTSFQFKIFFIIAWVSRNVKLLFARS